MIVSSSGRVHYRFELSVRFWSCNPRCVRKLQIAKLLQRASRQNSTREHCIQFDFDSPLYRSKGRMSGDSVAKSGHLRIDWVRMRLRAKRAATKPKIFCHSAWSPFIRQSVDTILSMKRIIAVTLAVLAVLVLSGSTARKQSLGGWSSLYPQRPRGRSAVAICWVDGY
jgi:hypothetical protein